MGYDDNYYIFNDPQHHKQTYYRKAAVEVAYAGLFKQAVVIDTNSPKVLNKVCRLKIREILSAFPAAQLYKIPDEKVLDYQFPVCRTPDLDIDVTVQQHLLVFPQIQKLYIT